MANIKDAEDRTLWTKAQLLAPLILLGWCQDKSVDPHDGYNIRITGGKHGHILIIHNGMATVSMSLSVAMGYARDASTSSAVDVILHGIPKRASSGSRPIPGLSPVRVW